MTGTESPARAGAPWAWLIALVLTVAAIQGGAAWKHAAEHPELVPSSSILAILAGVLARNLLHLPAVARRGSKGIIKTVIPLSIVLLGAGLDLAALTDPQLGVGGLAITVACMLVALLAAFGASKLMGLSGRTAGLLAAGTAVCGSSAIMAVAPVVEAEDDEIVVALGTVNLMGLLAMLAVPALAAAFDLADDAAGLFAGTSVHAVPQAVAAGAAVSDAAAGFATLFKMVRVAMLAPLVFGFGAFLAWRRPKSHALEKSKKIGSIVPWFVWGFLALSALRTFGALDFEVNAKPLGDVLAGWGKHLLTFSMVAIGLEIDLRKLLGVGLRGLLAGTLTSALLLFFSLLCSSWL
ncbi:MAG: putative sulfate exporter family transporter [Planctomycetes bacterium]|nr:putative sulfate exporter family transporter [Planctomycetota bacterium]